MSEYAFFLMGITFIQLFIAKKRETQVSLFLIYILSYFNSQALKTESPWSQTTFASFFDCFSKTTSTETLPTLQEQVYSFLQEANTNTDKQATTNTFFILLVKLNWFRTRKDFQNLPIFFQVLWSHYSLQNYVNKKD